MYSCKMRSFFKAICATRPASLSRRLTVLFDAWIPFYIHPVLRCGTVSLLYVLQRLSHKPGSPLSWSICIGPGRLAPSNYFLIFSQPATSTRIININIEHSKETWSYKVSDQFRAYLTFIAIINNYEVLKR